MINDIAKEIMKELSKSLKKIYQNKLESMRDNEFFFDYVHLLYYKCHITYLNCGGLYIDSPDWIKN